jgi:hypothetical protein
MSKPTITIDSIQYNFNGPPGRQRDEYTLKMRLTNCDTTKCRMFIASEHNGKEYTEEEIDEGLSGEIELILFGATKFHIYLFCGDLGKYNKKIYYEDNIVENMRKFCEDGNGCTMTKETINVAPPPPRGGRRRKSHPRSSGSRRSGSRRSGSKRHGSKRRGGSRRRRGGSRRRR